ncbi:MAG: hypothetical protein U1E45_12200 [Geminicoccaceae bacterium]
MNLDRRTVLGTLAGSVAAATLPSRPAEAGNPNYIPSILLYNRSIGAWLFQTPAGLRLPGTRSRGTDTARFAGVASSVGVVRGFQGNFSVGMLSLRGSTVATPTWEVSAFTGNGWTRRAGDNLTSNGARLIPERWLLDDDRKNITMIGAQRAAHMRLTLTTSANSSWLLRTRGLYIGDHPVDTNYAIAGGANPWFWGMAKGASLAEFQNLYFDSDRAPRLAVMRRLGTLRGHVYGPVSTAYGSTLLVYEPASGLGQFVKLGISDTLDAARILVTAQLAVGWTHVVPFKHGWFFYHRTRRCAQIATVAPLNFTSGPRLRNGHFWPDGSLPEFTDAVGYPELA